MSWGELNRSAASKLEGTPPLRLLNIGRNVRVIGEATAVAVHKNQLGEMHWALIEGPAQCSTRGRELTSPHP